MKTVFFNYLHLLIFKIFKTSLGLYEQLNM